jgi:N-acetylmannosamine-6-phosphate 2-epimerase/N-acetylmannosamine kinase
MAAILAIDIGGTKMLAASVRDGAVVVRRRLDTRPNDGPEAWLAALKAATTDWSAHNGVAAAVSGVVRAGRWSAVNPATLPVPDGFPLAERLRAVFGCDALAVNDAQAAAWAEHRFGAGAGGDLVFLTVSTGIGGGIVSGGRLLEGDTGLAGSLGQILIESGGIARLEDRASGRAIADAARACGHQTDSVATFAAAARGEAWAVAILDRSARAIAYAIAHVKMLIDPPLVAIGGGVGLAPGYLARVRRALTELPALYHVAIAPAALGAESGLLGAADLFVERRARP